MDSTRSSMPPTSSSAMLAFKQARYKLSDTAVVIALCRSHRYIAVSLNDTTIRVFTSDGQLHSTLEGETKNSYCLALRDDVLLSGEVEGNIQSWDLITKKQICTSSSHLETVRCLEFVDSKKAISASRDKTLKIWDLESGVCRTTLQGHEKPIVCLALRGEVAVSGSYDSTCRVWSLREECHLKTLSGHNGGVYAVSLDGVRIVSGSLDQEVRVWDLASGACTAVLRGHTSLVSHIIIQNNELVTGGADGQIGVWDLESSELKYAMLAAHDYSINSMWVQDGQIISGGSDGRVKLWELKTGDVIQNLGTKAEAVWKVAFGEAEVKNAVVALKHDAAFLDVWSFSA